MPCEWTQLRLTGAGVAAAISAAPGEGDKPGLATFTGNAYTGAPMAPGGWWGRIVCDLSGIKVPSQHRPVLRQHDHEQIVGHTTGVLVDADGVQVEGVFSGQREHTDKVTVPAAGGFRWQLSIGADPIRTEFLESGETTEVNGRQITGPITISRETVLGEVSFVPLGADGDTSATVSASRGSAMYKGMLKALMAGGNVRAAKYSDDDVDKMSEDEAKAALKQCMADADDKADEDKDAKAKAADEGASDDDKKAEARATARIQAVRRAEAAELARVDEVKLRCRRHGVVEAEVDGKKVNLVAHAIQAGWT